MKSISLFGLLLILSSFVFVAPEWGFYGHRIINRKAVFTLPAPLISFYKVNLEYITEHAVDPDKRRYATKHEAVRHYIDADHWGSYPFDNIPKTWHEVILKYGLFINETGDTLQLDCWNNFSESQINREVCDSLYALFYENIGPLYYEDNIELDKNQLKKSSGGTFHLPGERFTFIDQFSEYGILPYHLKQYYDKLVDAFYSKDQAKVLRLSAEIGHYIGDAHVPLHTTENYNGQLTDQIGIHGFWESRLPELFAEEEYDFFVGKAEYIQDPANYFWDVVLESHALLEDVLAFEKSLSQDFPQDQQYCFEERLERTIRTQCEPYASAYHTALDGMVEKRMRDAILSIGSVWFSAWIDAGQPNMSIDDKYVLSEEEEQNKTKLNRLFNSGDIMGRNHQQE